MPEGFISALTILVVRGWDKYDRLRFAWQLRKKFSTKCKRYVRTALWTACFDVTYCTNIEKLTVLSNRRKQRISRSTSFEQIEEKVKKHNSIPESLTWS